MTDELTMAKADEDAQRVYAKKLAADRESQKRKCAEESKEQQGNRLEAKERKTAQLHEDPPGQRESNISKLKMIAMMIGFIAAVSTCVELDREQSYSTSDLLSYVQNNRILMLILNI